MLLYQRGRRQGRQLTKWSPIVHVRVRTPCRRSVPWLRRSGSSTSAGEFAIDYACAGQLHEQKRLDPISRYRESHGVTDYPDSGITRWIGGSSWSRNFIHSGYEPFCRWEPANNNEPRQ